MGMPASPDSSKPSKSALHKETKAILDQLETLTSQSDQLSKQSRDLKERLAKLIKKIKDSA